MFVHEILLVFYYKNPNNGEILIFNYIGGIIVIDHFKYI